MICEVSGRTIVTILVLFSTRFFPLGVSLKSNSCNHTVVLTQLQLGRIHVLFYQKDQISILPITCE